MKLAIRPARRSEAKPLVGLYAASGKGKTMSALLLARGFVGPSGKIVMIETESGRGEVYADSPEVPGGYDVIPLRDDFSPKIYGEAITLAEEGGANVLIIDSASHEWEGTGGVLDMASVNQAKGKKGMIVWQQPKMDHAKHFMIRLMQTPIDMVIVCMRAKYPMEQGYDDRGKKTLVRSTELSPKQSEDLLFEMMIHGWVDEKHAFRGTKYTRPDLKDVMPDGKPITLETGKALATWAAGARPKPHPDLAEALLAIGKCETLEALESVGVSMKASGFTGKDYDDARVKYMAKMAELSQ
ncbi:MAG: AAA family ATPase [Hyphomicrobium sp.]